jgi:AhpD family alkylhydroperoxidase
MAGKLARLALRRTLSQVRYVTPVHPRDADAQTSAIYAQIEADFGMLAPPAALHSPSPRTLAAAWLMLRESLVTGAVDRPAKEAVAAAVSLSNSCPYCVTVHSSTLGGLSAGPDAIAIAAGDLSSVHDDRLRGIALWASAGATRAGAEGQDWPFPPAQAAELIGVAVTFQYLNRMVNVFLGDSPLPDNAPTTARKLLGWMMGRDAAVFAEPGASLDFLPPAAGNLPWASENPVVGEAFTRAAAAIESSTAVTEPIRSLLQDELSDWDGESPGLGRGWVNEAVSVLPEREQPAGRLALLTAKASYQVDEDVVAEFRATQPDDADLIELTAYASMAAATKVGEWLWLGRVTADH